MIERARSRQCDGFDPPTFFVSDCRERPSLPCSCDVALAIDDVVNCMGAEEDLISMFSQIGSSLTDSGIFIFDLVLHRAYEEYMRPATLRKAQDCFFLTYPDFIDALGCAKRGMKRVALLPVGSRSDQWQKEEYSFTEYYHRIETIRECLSKANLEVRDCFELREPPKRIDIAADSGEIYKALFVCSKGKGGCHAGGNP